MKEEPSYYSVIPANVRYDERLTPNAKLLYSEITALCNKHGYCWASNGYFSELYGKSKGTVSSWVKQLEIAGYITSEVKRNEKNEVIGRYIRLCQKIDIPSLEKSTYPSHEKPEDNTTRIDYYKNNNRERARFKKPTVEEIRGYIIEKGYRVDPERFIDYYESNGWMVGRSKMKDWKATVRNWERRERGDANAATSEYADIF